MAQLRQLLIYAPFVGLFLQVMLAGILLAKKTWNRCPIFVAYSVSNLAASVGLFLLGTVLKSVNSYFYFYWFCEVLSMALGFGVVYEIFKALLSPHVGLRRLAKISFRYVLAALLLLAFVAVYMRWTATENPVVAGIVVMEQGIRIVELGLLMFLFIFSTAFGLHWRQQVFGIALGLGIFISAELAGVTVFAHFGQTALIIANAVRALSFNLSMVIWLGYVLAPERVTNMIDLPKTAQLERWNQAIMELIHQ